MGNCLSINPIINSQTKKQNNLGLKKTSVHQKRFEIDDLSPWENQVEEISMKFTNNNCCYCGDERGGGGDGGYLWLWTSDNATGQKTTAYLSLFLSHTLSHST